MAPAAAARVRPALRGLGGPDYTIQRSAASQRLFSREHTPTLPASRGLAATYCTYVDPLCRKSQPRVSTETLGPIDAATAAPPGRLRPADEPTD